MSKHESKSLQMTLAFATTLAALGTSVGVPVALAQASKTVRPEAAQMKIERSRKAGATQLKYRAHQMKIRKGARGAVGKGTELNPQPEPPKPPFTAPGSGRMLNPQPLPPKSRTGASGR